MRHLFFSRQSHESQSTVCIKSAFRFPPCFACWCIVAVPIYRDVFTAAASQHRPGRLAAASRRHPRGLHRRCEMRRATTACPATSSAVLSYGPRHIRAGIVVKELTWAPKRSPKPEQKAGPEIFRRCAPEPVLQIYAPGDPPPPFPAPLRAQGAHMGAMSQNAFIPTRETLRRSFQVIPCFLPNVDSTDTCDRPTKR